MHKGYELSKIKSTYVNSKLIGYQYFDWYCFRV